MSLKTTVESLVAASASENWSQVARLVEDLNASLKQPHGSIDLGDGYKLLESLSLALRSGGFDVAATTMDPGLAKLVADLIAATNEDTRDFEAIQTNCAKLYDLLADPALPIPLDPEKNRLVDMLLALRSVRAFEPIARLSDRLLTRGYTLPYIRILNAQSLIETGKISAAISSLKDVLNSTRLEPKHRSLAHGLLGRALKQIYVNHMKGSASALPYSVREALRESIRSYGALYDRENLSSEEYSRWAGINLVGTLKLAEWDNIAPPIGFSAKADDIAKDIIEGHAGDPVVQYWANPSAPKPANADADPWMAATLAEAHLAKQNWSEAARYFGIFADHPKTTAFHLGSAIRQLEEVWRLEKVPGVGAQILTALRIRMLRLVDGTIDLNLFESMASQRSLDQTRSAGGELEAVLGEFAGMGITWWANGLKRAASVARITFRDGRTNGTGFIVRGGDLYEPWGDELMIVTNNHVVCSKAIPYRGALMPGDARISFDLELGATRSDRLECAQDVVWTSHASDHDATVLRLKGGGSGAAAARLRALGALQLASVVPALDIEDRYAKKKGTTRPSQVLIIGHSRGEDLHISFRNNELLGAGTKSTADPNIEFLHYRAPTEKGNSGSPVFEEFEWNVVGLHHMGSEHEALSRSSSKRSKNQPANEGISIASIRDAIRRNPTTGS